MFLKAKRSMAYSAITRFAMVKPPEQRGLLFGDSGPNDVRQSMPALPHLSHVDLFSEFDRVINLDAKVSNCTLDLGVTK